MSNKLVVELRINLQLTGKISLKLDFKSSLLLDYGRKDGMHQRKLS